MAEKPVKVMESTHMWTPLAFIGGPKPQHQVTVHASGERSHSGLYI